MSSWGSVDFRELTELCNRIGKLAGDASGVDFDKVCVSVGNKCAQVLLNKVKKRTPVGHKPDLSDIKYGKVKTIKIKKPGSRQKKIKVETNPDWVTETYWKGYRGGTLRDAWKALPPVFSGDHYTFVVLNPMKYASFVEYGHRQHPGRYVPALGKRLKESWVKGRYMLTISENELKGAMPRIIEKEVNAALRGAVDGK